MKKVLLIFSLLLVSVLLIGCQEEESDQLKVAVTIIPQAGFVEAVGGDLVDVTTIIPVGFSPANYEPSARQIVEINQSAVYFTLGVPAESANIIPELSNVDFVYLEEEVSLIYDDLYFDHEHTHGDELTEEHAEFSRDPHIWLSIKRVKVMIGIIAETLSELDPDNEAIYQANATDYLALLDALDTEITTMFEDKTMRTFIVYHPSYGYFADDYNLEMLALEEDGKDPSITHLQELIDYARDNDIYYVYHQAEIDSERVETFKDDINGQSVELYPLAYDYIQTMREMAQKINEGLS